MRFDVFLVRANLSSITGGEIRKYFRARGKFEVNQQGTNLVLNYKNPLTRASFTISYVPGGLGEKAGRPGEAFQRAELICSIEYLRPSYYAYEASVEIERLANSLMLSAINPQSRKSPDTPVACSSKEILADWQAANSQAVAAHNKKNKPPMAVVPPKFTGQLWKYMLVADALRKKLGPEVEVPDIGVMREGAGQAARTAFIWSYAEPMLVAPARSVLINRLRRKGIFGIGRKEESGIASYDDVIAALNPFMETLNLDKPKYSARYLPPEKSKAAFKAFRSIPLEPIPLEMEEVTDDRYVDVLPPKPAAKKSK